MAESRWGEIVENAPMSLYLNDMYVYLVKESGLPR